MDSKYLVTLIGLMIAVFAVFNFNGNISEGFGMLPSMTWKVDRSVAANTQAAMKGDFFSVPGTYQAMLEPRMYGGEYGANINYNLPSYNNQGVPCTPLTFPANTAFAKENYVKQGCDSNCRGVADCRKGGAPKAFVGAPKPTEPGYASGNYNEMLDSVYSGSSYPEATAMLPANDMMMVNALGETTQPIVYDRFIYANRNSRLRSLGDPIRGDLPIVPYASDWFRPSVQPNIDLQEGAMNVLGGNQNETANQLASLIYKASGSGDTTIGGVNMSAQYLGELSGGFRDVNVTSYP